MTTREQIIAAAIEADSGFGGGEDEDGTMTDSIVGFDAVERFYTIAFEAGRITEREECFSLKKDAIEIFNSNPTETSQEVRDVIEWFSEAIRTRSTK